MRLAFITTYIHFKHLACTIVLLGMLITPIAQTVAMLSDTSISWIDSTEDNTSDEEEKQEKDGDDEKKKLQILSPSNYPLYQTSPILCFQFTQGLFDHSLEIHIPPPDQA